MESNEEIKASIERNKQIRAEENAHQKDVMKSTLDDKEMREHYDLMNKRVTATSKDDAREKKIKGWLIALGIVVVLAAVGVALYFVLK